MLLPGSKKGDDPKTAAPKPLPDCPDRKMQAARGPALPAFGIQRFVVADQLAAACGEPPAARSDNKHDRCNTRPREINAIRDVGVAENVCRRPSCPNVDNGRFAVVIDRQATDDRVEIGMRIEPVIRGQDVGVMGEDQAADNHFDMPVGFDLTANLVDHPGTHGSGNPPNRVDRPAKRSPYRKQRLKSRNVIRRIEFGLASPRDNQTHHCYQRQK